MKRTQVKKSKTIAAKTARKAKTLEPGLEGLFEVLDEAWSNLEADHRNTAFDDIAHNLLSAMHADTISIGGMKRLLTALWASASEDERQAVTGAAIKAHIKHGHHCLCCKAALGEPAERLADGKAAA